MQHFPGHAARAVASQECDHRGDCHGQSGELLGAHRVGESVTEMIQGYTIARGLETTDAELIDSIPPPPTLSETMHEALLATYELLVVQRG